MNPEPMATMLAHPVARAVGWSLIHFLWQGVLISCAAALAFSLLSRARSQARYLAGCVALAVMAIAPALSTAVVLRADITAASATARPGAVGAHAATAPPDAVDDSMAGGPPPQRRATTTAWAGMSEDSWMPALLAA